MSRLSPELPTTEQISTVVTDQNFTVYARLIWVYLNSADQPQNSNSLVAELGISPSTVSRAVAALRQRGLIRRLNGVWIPQSPTTTGEAR
ncbi:MarR family transcriptional regulator [Streptomyces sp. NPDC003299]